MYSKKVTFLILLIIVSLKGVAQQFEGEIIYQNVYKSKTTGVTDDQFTTFMGSTQDYFIKDGHYKSITNGSLLQWQIYNPIDNRMYTKMSNSEAALWSDAGQNPDSVLTVTLNKAAVDILGYKCDELILNCRSGIQKYYFNPGLRIDSRIYAKHKFGNWYYFLSESNAIPLKMVIDNAGFTLTSTAVEVKPSKLDVSLFQLPDGMNIVKSPY